MNGCYYKDKDEHIRYVHVAMQDASSTAFALEDVREALIAFHNCSAFFNDIKGASEKNIYLIYICEKTVHGQL